MSTNPEQSGQTEPRWQLVGQSSNDSGPQHHEGMGPWRIEQAGQPMTRQQWLSALSGNPSFRRWFDRELGLSAPEAYAFETPAWSLELQGEPLEFVCVPSPSLVHAQVDPHSFAAHFDAAKAGQLALSFSNLGGDAQLVVPMPGEIYEHYAHLGVFLRSAPEERRHALWQQLARAIIEQLDERPRWVSTAGLGVIWLHWRIGVRPKYYRHRPYMRRPAQCEADEG